MSLNQRRMPWLTIIVVAYALSAVAFVRIGKSNGSNEAVVQTAETRLAIKGSLEPFPLTADLKQQADTQRDKVRVEQLTLWPTGFKPAEIRRAAGPIALITVNNTRLQEISLRLNDESGNRLRAVRIAPGKREWREYVDLRPGIYVISEASHPDWSCRLIISAR
jgi:hypothetical protein